MEELSICCFGAWVISAGVGGGVSNAFGLFGLENSTTFCFFVVVDEWIILLFVLWLVLLLLSSSSDNKINDSKSS